MKVSPMLRGRGWPSLCAEVCERKPAKQASEFKSSWAGFRTFLRGVEPVREVAPP